EYAAAFFLIVAFAYWLSHHGPVDLRRLRTALSLLVICGWALVTHVSALQYGAQFFANRGYETRAAVDALLRYGGSPALPDDHQTPEAVSAWLKNLPSPATLHALVVGYGSPLGDPWLQAAGEVPPEVSERILLMLVGDSLAIELVDSIAVPVSPPNVRRSDALTLSTVEGCTLLTPTGATLTIELAIETGKSLFVSAEFAGQVTMFLSLSGVFEPGAGVAAQPPFTQPAARPLSLVPGTTTRVSLPDLGEPAPWLVLLELPAEGQFTICVG
ncbi:MAG: hypothetical protein ACR2H0_06775, partial [Candidatus Limnocylindrales bacterium]